VSGTGADAGTSDSGVEDEGGVSTGSGSACCWGGGSVTGSSEMESLGGSTSGEVSGGIEKV
jgi:hypothetical protein